MESDSIGYSISFWCDANVINRLCGDSCTTLNHHIVQFNGLMVNFYGIFNISQ